MGAPVPELRDDVHVVYSPGGEAVKKHRPGRHCQQGVKKRIAGDFSLHGCPDVGDFNVGDCQQAAQL